VDRAALLIANETMKPAMYRMASQLAMTSFSNTAISSRGSPQRLLAKSTELFPGTTVRRVIPQVACRSIGPFVFLDHFGPTTNSMNVGPHPHIGLCTLTYLYDGGVLHRDSTGVEQPILPNQVNWMYSGKGVTHSERPMEGTEGMHGLQLWVALPKDQEDMDPIFYHSPAVVDMDTESSGVHVKLVVGSALNKKQLNIPLVPGLEKLFLLSVEFQNEGPDETAWSCPSLGDESVQVGIYVSSGSATVNDHDPLQVGEMLLTTGVEPFTIKSNNPETKVAIFGGPSFPEKRHLLWNFCSWDTQKLKNAADHWTRLDRSMFPPVAHESNEDSIPLPTRRQKK
jgi:redox-sensitive bicupin YhaK (pirin superfamily)